MKIIDNKLRKMDKVLTDGVICYVSEIVSTHQKMYTDKTIKGVKSRVLVGFEKPQITVYRNHCGKVLTSSDRYIGENYKVIG